MPNNEIQFWDIEATNLNADFGYILSVAIGTLDSKKIDLYTIQDYPEFKKDNTSDRALVEDVSARLSDGGIWVTWYGQRYDVPMVNSRLINHGLPVMPPVPHIDLWRVCREKLKLHSNRLASAAAFLGLEEKTSLSGPIWIKAGAGDKKALQYVAEHNVQDVVVLKQAYEKMRPLISNGPNVALLNGPVEVESCPVCGSSNYQKRGTRVAKANRFFRLHCQKCGAWWSQRIKKGEASN